MKNIITAIGNPKLNNIIREQKKFDIKGQDIQYQEGIFEALDKHKDIDGIIIKEDIIGELSLEDLIRNIIILKNDIEIILITNQEKEKIQNENIVKLLDNNKNYVKEAVKYLFNGVYIKPENETQLTEEDVKSEPVQEVKNIGNKIILQKREGIKTLVENIKKQILNLLKKQKATSKIITVIGNPGVR